VGTQGYVCLPRPQALLPLPGPSTRLAPKPLFLLVSSTGLRRQSHTSLAPIPTPIRPPQTHYPSAAQRGRVPSIAARCGHNRCRRFPLGSDQSCPNVGAIACLLLQSIGSEAGLAGAKFLTQTTFIQRLNTQGGSAPATGCSVLSDVGKQTLVPYTADYYFFHADK